MSDIATTPHAADGHGHDDHGHGHGHNPHLAHHFDTMEQQYDSGKLGMWVFLATELLMFGGLFCAYSVYRSNHPEIFLYAHHYLNTTLGAINTAILLASSLTMAWAVRLSQINKPRGLIICLILTLLGGAGFMVIKAIEYEHKFHDHLAPGLFNKYNTKFEGTGGETNPEGEKKFKEEKAHLAPTTAPTEGIAGNPAVPFLYQDPNTGGNDQAKIHPVYSVDGSIDAAQLVKATHGVTATVEPHGDAHGESGHGESHAAGGDAHGKMEFTDLDSQLSRQRVNTFFGIYYCMTGLHGVHVLVGMGLIFWVLYRSGNTMQRAWIPPLLPLGAGAYLIFLFAISHVSAFVYIGVPIGAIGALWLAVRMLRARSIQTVTAGEFSDAYYAPVDLVGLYWHLVDLIWIFLFPLLYLIHGKVGS